MLRYLIASMVWMILSFQLANAEAANKLFSQLEDLSGVEFSGSGLITRSFGFDTDGMIHVNFEDEKYGFTAVVQDGRETMKKIENCAENRTFQRGHITSSDFCFATFEGEYVVNDLASRGALGMGPIISLKIWIVDFPNM